MRCLTNIADGAKYSIGRQLRYLPTRHSSCPYFERTSICNFSKPHQSPPEASSKQALCRSMRHAPFPEAFDIFWLSPAVHICYKMYRHFVWSFAHGQPLPPVTFFSDLKSPDRIVPETKPSAPDPTPLAAVDIPTEDPCLVSSSS